MRLLSQAGVPTCVIGNGSNLLVADNGIRGAVIRLTPNFARITRDGDNGSRRRRRQVGARGAFRRRGRIERTGIHAGYSRDHRWRIGDERRHRHRLHQRSGRTSDLSDPCRRTRGTQKRRTVLWLSTQRVAGEQADRAGGAIEADTRGARYHSRQDGAAWRTNAPRANRLAVIPRAAPSRTCRTSPPANSSTAPAARNIASAARKSPRNTPILSSPTPKPPLPISATLPTGCIVACVKRTIANLETGSGRSSATGTAGRRRKRPDR